MNTAAANLLIQGAFNVNSTSVDAWKALLAGNHNRFTGSGTPLESPFFRFFSNDLSKQGDPWAGFSEVGTTAGADPTVDTQLQLLAEAIVEQVKLRGPFRSLAEFVNRRSGRQRTRHQWCAAELRSIKAGSMMRSTRMRS